MNSTILLVTTALCFAAGTLCGLSLANVWDAIAQRYLADLQPMLDALAIDQRKIRVSMRWWGAAIVTSLAMLTLLDMFPLALAVAMLLLVAPRVTLHRMIRQRRSLLRDQLVGGTTALAGACRAGLSLAVGLETISKEVPHPLSTELRGIVGSYEHGCSLDEAIKRTKDRLQLDSFTLFASAICVSLQRGGRITESLERIAHSLQENQRVERKLESETAGGRRVVWILTAFPFLFLGGFYVMHPVGVGLMFQSLVGQLVLLIVIALVVLSVWWSNKILSIEL